MTGRTGPAAALAALALAAAGCMGGDGGSSDLFADVTQEQLATMVLPPSSMRGLGDGLEIDPEESGYAPNAEEAEDTIDPDDTGATLAEIGRRTGYELTVLDTDFSSVQAGSGIFSVSSSAELFDDTEGALAYLEEQLAAYEDFEGREVDEGVRLTSVTLREQAGVGEEARLLVATILAGQTQLRAYLVAFQLDRMVGATLVMRPDREDATADAVALAEELEQRMRDVAAGRLDEEPVPLPAPGEDEAGPTA